MRNVLEQNGWEIRNVHKRQLNGYRVMDIIARRGNKWALIEVKANDGWYSFRQQIADLINTQEWTRVVGKPNVNTFLWKVKVNRVTGAVTTKSITAVGGNSYATGFARLLRLGGRAGGGRRK